ncbi:MAG: PAS domain S-box protein [Pyrinomonadaceae bacterium]|nr:PAS domain S-box protein [Pyrinomonadaceae bacterium]
MSENSNNFLNDELLGMIPDANILSGLVNSQNTLAELAGVFFPFQTAESQPFTLSEEELPDLYSRYRVLVEQIPAIVFMSFLDRGISEAYISPQIETMLGFTQAEWLEDPLRWFEQLHDEDKMRWSIEAAQMFLTGEPLKSTYRVRARDGHFISFHCEAKMVRRKDGRPWFIHGVAFDVTELKHKENELNDALTALRKSEKMQRNIFEFAPDTMIIVNRQGKIESVNSQIKKMFGYEAKEVLGKDVLELVPERFRGSHAIHQNAFMKSPHLREMGGGLELYARRKDGTEFPADIILSPIETENGTFVITVIRDITRRKRDENSLKEFAERQGELSRKLLKIQEAERRNIALELHDEIGQILTGLKLSLELTSKNYNDDSIQQAQNLVNDLMVRVRKLSLDLRPATLDHLGLLSSFLWLFRNYTTQTGIEIDFNHQGINSRRFAPEIETSAYRVVQEALTNVARHSRVEIAKVRVWADEKNLSVSIEDDGQGFNLEEVTETASSTGVAGMRERVELLGGHFHIESVKDKGTKVNADWVLENENNVERDSNFTG